MSFSYNMDDEYEKLIRIMKPPRVVIDNESCKNATVIQVDSANKQGILLEVVQVLSDLNLLITKAYIRSDGGWFMDVFNVTDHDGNKITDEGVLDYIQKSLGPDSYFASSMKRSVVLDHTSNDGILPIQEKIAVEDGMSPIQTKLCDVCKTSVKESLDGFSFHGFRFQPDEGLAERRSIFNALILLANKSQYDPWDLPKSNTLGDNEWYFFCKRGRKYKNCVRPNRVTGSGFWKATGIDKPGCASNVKTGSVNKWETFISIFDSMDNRQQQFELPTNVGPSYRNGYGYNSSGGETSTGRPEVHIDILNGNDKGNNGHTDLVIYQAWNEYKNQIKNSKFDDDAMKMMSGTFAAVAGQVVGGVMVNRLTSSASSSSSSWAGPIVEAATVLGLCVSLAGISLRRRSRPLSTLMIKIGAVMTASAIIFSMGLHLPPVMAWTVGPVAFLIMAAAAAFA